MLKLFNTLTRRKEIFKPIEKKLVKIYSCGPTIYQFAHIGNFRAYICADILKRYLKYKGYKVMHVMNITDVDDKTIKGANVTGISLKEYTQKYEKAFFEDIASLNIDKADVYPKATEHIDEMISLIEKLLKNDCAYKTKDGIYFNIKKFHEYGKLSHIDLSELKAGARISTDEYDKQNVQDFALWKFWKPEDGPVFWEDGFGKGRPGWHIECSAMSMKYLNQCFDIHSGGVDLIFPHHENEIAQSECATGKKFVKYWIHNEHLLVNGKKMSKSLGNFYTLRDVLEKSCKPLAIRYLLLATHYRQQLNFSFDSLESATATVNKINDFFRRLNDVEKEKSDRILELKIGRLIAKARKEFAKAMDDDLNISSGLAAFHEFIREINIIENKLNKKTAKSIINFVKELDSVLGILEKAEEKGLSEEEQKLIQEREIARKKKDWTKADEIRHLLKSKGIQLDDTPSGVRWKRIN